MKMIKTFFREELYEEIWEISAKQVSLKYDLNYSDLLKKCREADIPIPKSGYWYRKKTGQDLTDFIIPLPKNKVSEVHIYRKTLKNSKLKNTMRKEETSKENFIDNYTIDADSIKNSLSFLDKTKVNRIIEVISDQTHYSNKRLHKIVANLRDSIEEWNKREKAAAYPYFDSRYRFNNLDKPRFVKDIPLSSLPRLYCFLNTLITIIEKLGDNITKDFDIKINKDIVSFEIVELTDKVNHELTKEEAKKLAEYNDSKRYDTYASKPRIRKYDYIPNGKFRFKIINGRYIKDSQQFIMIYQEYYKVKNLRIEREEAARRYAEGMEIKRKLQEEIEEEKKRTLSLLNMLDDFQKANDLRKMADRLEVVGKISDDEINWIRAKADWLDPVVSSTDELLGDRNHHDSKEQKERYLSEKKYYW